MNMPENPRGRGRPRDTWWRSCKEKAEKANLKEEDMQDRRIWNLRSRARNFDSIRT